MKFVHLLFVLLALTFFPFHEGILARTSSWKRLADVIDFNALKALTWRSSDAIMRELGTAERHFVTAAAVALAVLAFSFRLPLLFIWVSIFFFVTFFVWVAFRWSFNEREALQQIAPILGYSLIPAWLFLLVDYAGPKMGLFTAQAEKLWFLKYAPYSTFELAGFLFAGVAALLVLYFLFSWLIFQPFGWLVLAALKASRNVAAMIEKRAGRDLLFPVSVAVQGFGLVYLYWISRHL